MYKTYAHNKIIKERHVPGLRVGKSGLEKTFENELIGTNGIQRFEVNAFGKKINQLFKIILFFIIDHFLRSFEI